MAALACNFGVKTYAGFGGYPLPATWATLSGPAATDWTVSTDGSGNKFLVPSGPLGTQKTFAVQAPGQYVLTCVETSDTVTITMLDSAAHAASPSEVKSLLFVSSSYIGPSWIKRGDTIWCRDGDYYYLTPTMPKNGWDLPAGAPADARVTIRPEHETLMTTGAGPGARLFNLSYEPKYATNVPGAKWWLWLTGFLIQGQRGSNLIQVGAINCASSRKTHNLKQTRLRVFGGVLQPTDTSGYTSGINMVGDDMILEDILIHDVSDGLNITGSGQQLRRVAIVRASDDSFKLSASTRHLVEDCWSFDKKTVGGGQHPDHFQQSNLTLALGVNPGNTHRRLMLVCGRDNADGQGDFNDDGPIVGGVAAVLDGQRIENLFVLNNYGNALFQTMVDNATITRCTAMRDNHAATSSVMIFHGCQNCTVTDSAFESYYDTDYTYQRSTEKPPAKRYPSGNAFIRTSGLDFGAAGSSLAKMQAIHAKVFNAPIYGSAAQCCPDDRFPLWDDVYACHAKIAQAWAPKVLDVADGGLRNPDGTYQGAFFPDGRWNDGSVYGQATATTFAVSAEGIATVGVPLPVTVAINAALATDTLFTLTRTGAAGSFVAATVTIPAGQVSATGSFVPAAAGSVTLGATTTAALSSIGSATVVVSAPSGNPTTSTLALGATTGNEFRPVVVTLGLNQVTSLPLAFTLTSSRYGQFSQNPAVFPAGVSSIQVTFTPMELGLHAIAASPPTGIAAAAAVSLTVGVNPPSRGYLRFLGMRV